MSETREDKQVRGYLNEGFTFKDVFYKPMTIRTLLLLERVKSPFYFGGDNVRGLMDFLYVSSTDSKTVIKTVDAGEFEEAVMDFSEQFTMEDLEDIGKIVNTQNADVSATLVELTETESEKK